MDQVTYFRLFHSIQEKDYKLFQKNLNSEMSYGLWVPSFNNF